MDDWKSEKIDLITAALLKAKIENPTKNSENAHFRNRYADLGAVIDASREALRAVGIVLIQQPGERDGKATVATVLLHESGQWLRSVAVCQLAKNDPQGMGSALSYLRRYGSMAMLNMAAEDDDGNAASRPDDRKPPRAAEVKPAQKAPQALLEEFRRKLQVAASSADVKRVLLDASKVFEKGTPERDQLRDDAKRREVILASDDHDPETGEVRAGVQ